MNSRDQEFVDKFVQAIVEQAFMLGLDQDEVDEELERLKPFQAQILKTFKKCDASPCTPDEVLEKIENALLKMEGLDNLFVIIGSIRDDEDAMIQFINLLGDY